MKNRVGAKPSGQQSAVANVQRFALWIGERDAARDWDDYLQAGVLNKSEVAAECGFSRSVFYQNPGVRDVLQRLEKRLGTSVLSSSQTEAACLSGEAADPSGKAVDRRTAAGKAQAEARIKALAEQNATLQAEVRDLRKRLLRYEHLDSHLSKTGRLLPP